jgi:hypothetical protein
MLDFPGDHPFISLTCSACGKVHDIPTRCADRFCPVCSRSRAQDIRHALTTIFARVHPPRGQNLKMLTLSLPNCQRLDLGISHLVRSFRKLRQRRFWNRYVSGGATIIEITGKQGDYHPHLHILMYSSFIPWEMLLAQWQEVSGGRGCYIQDISNKSATFYVTKYLTKPELPQGDLDEVSREIKKYRLFQRFGSWHNVIIPKRESQWRCESCGCKNYLTQYEIAKYEHHFDSS